jgi:hypothetical protein
VEGHERFIRNLESAEFVSENLPIRETFPESARQVGKAVKKFPRRSRGVLGLQGSHDFHSVEISKGQIELFYEIRSRTSGTMNFSQTRIFEEVPRP